MIFSSADHNRERFQVEDPPWVEALFWNTRHTHKKRKTIYLPNTESRNPLKNGERKTYKVYFHLRVPFAPQTVEEQFPHLIPSLSSVKAGDNKCRQIEYLTATIKTRNNYTTEST